MIHNRLQNKIAGSEFTLPFCVVLSACLWWLPERAFSVNSLLGLTLCLLTTYIIMETNAQQHIIRIRTRMMSCVWLVLAASLSFMHPLEKPIIAATFLSASYYLLFRCYQRYRHQATVFHAFLMLGIGSFFAPVMLPMAILFFFYLAGFLRSLTPKAFWAGILGLIAPYFFYTLWCFITNNMQSFTYHLPLNIFHLPLIIAAPGLWKEHFSPLLEEESGVRLFSTAFVALLSIVGIIHFLRTNYDDKIRVRMILYIYTMQTLLMMVFLFFLPEYYQTTMALIIASACPLIAHFFALTSNILSNLFFALSLLLTTAMAALNLWVKSFSIS